MKVNLMKKSSLKIRRIVVCLGQLMINVDLSTKVMNKQTVYSILMDKFNRFNDLKEAQHASLKELLGQIVLTPFVIFISS
jgi:hypothetical protein